MDSEKSRRALIVVLDGVGTADDTVVHQQEIPGGQPGHGPALAVTNHGADRHQVDAAAEDGLAFLGRLGLR